MPLRDTIYLKRSADAVTPEILLKHLTALDYWTLGEGYDIPEEAVQAALPLQIKNLDPVQFRIYHLTYAEGKKRPIEIERWESENQHRSAIEETIENLTIQDKARVRKISDLLQKSVDSVSVSYGVDPPASMFAWEVVRYFATKFDGIVEVEGGEWFTIGSDYQSKPL